MVELEMQSSVSRVSADNPPGQMKDERFARMGNEAEEMREALVPA